MLVYHARNYTEIEGDPLYDPNRHTRLKLIRWMKVGCLTWHPSCGDLLITMPGVYRRALHQRPVNRQ
ncbi:putative alpha-N-arabinofuranosidase II [Escherichia coli]|nr:putative alpha-N-arabinofuranosidase II [Escherichia coli]